MSEPIHDLFIIGGGINGCGIARDAAGRGYSVVLAEQADFASGTSSAATKLIHGGLRYLEHYEFRLVREALLEREALWAMAPHVIWPLRFVLPFHPSGIRPAWLIRLGLFLYDHIGGRKLLPPTRTLDMRNDPVSDCLKPIFSKAFEYSDGWVDDARLVVLNARDAKARGATILNRSKVVSAVQEGGIWHIEVVESDRARRKTYKARMLVNAAGPWVDRVLGEVMGQTSAHNVRLVQGSHIIVRRKYADARAFIFQNPDGRIVFAIPYEDDFTLIGTTDLDYRGDPGLCSITEGETDYLCKAASEYFAKPVEPSEIVWSYAGVRPLFQDGASKAQEATRDYVLKVATDGAPLLNIFGGKLTTYRRLAEHALEKIAEAIGGKGQPWTIHSHLPGGDFPATGFAEVVADFHKAYPFLSAGHARRLMRLYGMEAYRLMEGVGDGAGLGRHLGADLYEKEVVWLIEEEWAGCAQDILWRRTKLGLRLTTEDAEALDVFVADYIAGAGNVSHMAINKVTAD